MKAQAPGKLVLSGAYAVLRGAPALVTAVNRYVLADTDRSPTLVTEEVAASGLAHPPYFDATPLRHQGQKLGLGSSAAILVASLAADRLRTEPDRSEVELAALSFEPALLAHRKAQGGGSGIDVAASCFGGTLCCRRDGEQLRVQPTRLPSGLAVEVLHGSTAARTSEMLARLGEFERREPSLFLDLLGPLGVAARKAAQACEKDDARGFLRALADQAWGLDGLGRAAQVPIFTDELRALGELAAASGSVVLPSGAGGGDVSLCVSLASTPVPLLERFSRFDQHRLQLGLGARGVHPVRQGMLGEPLEGAGHG